MIATNTPHDALFKAVFSIPENAAAELRHVLGPLVDHLDLSTLELISGSLISEELRARHADLLFSLRAAGRDARLYILYEHKSGPEPWLHLALLSAMFQIWDLHLRDHPDARSLPVIIPVVVAHRDGGWHASTDFAALFDAPVDLLTFVPRFRFALDDLASQDPGALRRRDTSPFARLALLALQQARQIQHIERWLRDHLALLEELLQTPGGQRAISQWFEYLYIVCKVDPRVVDATITDIDPKVKDLMETYAEMYERRGRENGHLQGQEVGRKEGRQEATCAMLLRALRRRFGALPPALERKIQAADTALLEQWFDRCLDARGLDEVFV